MHDSLLSQLNIGELADVVDGRLRLGCLPPLGGVFEPVRVIGVNSQRVQPGDLFWGLNDQAGRHSWDAETAFMRHAAGAVVCQRRLEPWAGKYSIEVADTHVALWQLARHVRRRFGGACLGLLAPAGGDWSGWVQAVSGADLPRHVDPTIINDWTRLPLDVLSLRENSLAATLEMPVTCALDVEVFSHLCQPRIVAITSQHLSQLWPVGQTPNPVATRQRLAGALPEETWAVILETPETAGRAAPEARVSLTQRATGTQRELVASLRPKSGDPSVEIASGGQRLLVAGEGTLELGAMAVACAVGLLLGKTHAQLAASLAEAARQAAATGRPAGNRTTSSSNTRNIAEASPFVPGLRESGATLPPGLERFAY
ncbi:MAG: hypothetical protein J5I93_06430 [Pirellulaceae bacterium]|nr:hypothetical protein [Pirellulaceae bacterium]